ncbi:MAG TPA: ATP-dependent DNA helicase RecG [Candidatus Paceibacterota bacterium]|nr:ATP-dependent DNA helicase RecG [Candidatus Paceibacterota bacterium]
MPNAKPPLSLDDKLIDHLRITEDQRKALKRLNVETIRDLLYHFPARYSDISKVTPIADLVPGEVATIVARVVKTETKKGWKSKIPMAEAVLEDASGKITAIWFHQAYIAKMLPTGKTVTLTGRPTVKGGKDSAALESKTGMYLANAEFDRGTVLPIDSHETLFNNAVDDNGDNIEGAHIPIYPESRGVSSRFMHHALEKLIAAGALDAEPDPIPADILQKYKLPNWKTAMHWLHMPRKTADALAARKRFAFEEVFYIQLQKAKDRALLQTLNTEKIVINDDKVEEFIKRFGFTLTAGQREAVRHIFEDFGKGAPMSRLLEGDVGSGKTAVAAAAAFAVVTSTPAGKNGTAQNFGNLQVAYMAPTEILAAQHFESFIKFFEGMNIQIGLLTGKTARKFPAKTATGSSKSGWTDISKAQLLKWVANGEVPILVGTHSLIQKSVKFKHLSFVVIDEQHRFGVRQRMQLVRRTSGESLALADVAAEATSTTSLANRDFTYYKDLSYQISRIITQSRGKTGSLGHIDFTHAFREALRSEDISFQNSITVGGGKKNQISTKIDSLVESALAVVFRDRPFLSLSDKKKFETSLKYGNFALALVAYEDKGKMKIDQIKNPAFKKQTSAGGTVGGGLHGSGNANAASQTNKQPIPHLLSMTATPIPRTLALTIYGDLDLTVLSEMPAGRLPVITDIVPPTKRKQTYDKIRTELEAGRQLYVICPRIDEPDPDKEMAVQAKSVVAEAARLKREVFHEYTIGIMHSKMSKEKKEAVMQDFNDKKIDILCATSVVEVGVNVPNATNIIIEGSERFGLAQLHQLRGRVLRSNHQPYCYLFTEGGSERTAERLQALKTAKNGFELSELDLKLRGAGELAIGKQWGISDLAMEAIKNPKMVEAARTEAKLLVEAGALTDYPDLEKVMEKKSKELHFE